MEYKYAVYFKEDGVDKRFNPFNPSTGEIVKNIIYLEMFEEASLPKIKKWITEVEKENKNYHLQIRRNTPNGFKPFN